MLVMTTIFISKMEGLPPTSATKMIDYWLILCQLVPFIQVVLLTAKEYLREEKPEEDQHLDKQKVKMEKDEKPLMAWTWTISQIEYSKDFSLTVLTMIGKDFFEIYFSNRNHYREESDATDCTVCIRRLLCHCRIFLS